MSDNKTSLSSNNYGIGFSGFLTLLFVFAKLIGWISWSWWWVLSPILISTTLAIGIIVGIIIVALILNK